MAAYTVVESQDGPGRAGPHRAAPARLLSLHWDAEWIEGIRDVANGRPETLSAKNGYCEGVRVKTSTVAQNTDFLLPFSKHQKKSKQLQ